MRLGLLGPAGDDLAALARAAEFLLNGAKVTRAIYLGDNGALDEVVALWAESLVGPDPSDHGLWERCLETAIAGTPEQIDALLRSERGRLRLRSLEGLPALELRSVEMFGDRVAILVYDKALLNEEDIVSATFLIYGKGEGPLVKKIGARWFLSPGPLGGTVGGIVVLDDAGEEVVATFYSNDGRFVRTETLTAVRSAKLSVQG